ncbi:STAS domain-containing protein [Heliophilum fasciatum]|uniref:Anti-sigma factor antagonist n=1 Tax=Heliophilum fasciatum TaxID=35700 RepID=A0A4R2RPT3_9FIRM|nr:STAS domain-containing protein [Heliophilum fasciatum]MCW2277777.1 anti-anti-sigma factor [Heliophilum fasciatum]TCP64729.1 stage II sporulation protein AA (anti-sigma F factor antagonist) [Heliophilum fasciatum]
MELQCTVRETELWCAIDGELDMAVADQFFREVTAAIPADCTLIVFDMQKVPFIDSTGIGKLIRLIMQSQKQAIKCQVIHCHEELAEVMRLMGLFELLKNDRASGA